MVDGLVKSGTSSPMRSWKGCQLNQMRCLLVAGAVVLGCYGLRRYRNHLEKSDALRQDQ